MWDVEIHSPNKYIVITSHLIKAELLESVVPELIFIKKVVFFLNMLKLGNNFFQAIFYNIGK